MKRKERRKEDRGQVHSKRDGGDVIGTMHLMNSSSRITFERSDRANCPL